MASAWRALHLLKLSPLPPAASRFLRPLAAAESLLLAAMGPSLAAAPWAADRGFSTQPATSSLKDSTTSWSNRPSKETALLIGCDFEHWLVVMDPPPGNPANPDVSREEIIGTYIKTLAQVVGSEEEARMKIYSVSTRYYFAFGALVSEELSFKLKELPMVRSVLADSYLDGKNKDFGGEPFIDGQAVPYDPKYHENWVRYNPRANERSRRIDRPRSFDNRSMGSAPLSYQPPPPPPLGKDQMPPPSRPSHVLVGAPPNNQLHAPNQQSGYGLGAGPNYQNAPPAGYQAGNQGNPGDIMQWGPGPAYQGNNPGYLGGGPGNMPSPPIPGSSPGYGSSAQEYQGQAGNLSYQGNS